MVTEAQWKQWQPEDFHRYLDIVIEIFGCHRVMIGSDWPVCTLSGDYVSTMSIVTDYVQEFSTEVRDAILGGNCARFYGININNPTRGKEGSRGGQSPVSPIANNTVVKGGTASQERLTWSTMGAGVACQASWCSPLKRLMGPVAIRRVLRLLALTKPYILGFRGPPHQRPELRILV
jgi:hypothetical protein